MRGGEFGRWSDEHLYDLLASQRGVIC
jgi:hypothetical protein